MTSAIQQFDLNILEFINNNLHNPVLDKIMIALTMLGNLGLIWILIAAYLIFTKKSAKTGILILCALLLNLIIGDGFLKNIIQRPRPFDAVPAINLLISKPTSFSFPSGHTSSAFAAAGVFVSTMKKYRVYVIALALLIAFSRIYLFVHYPSDIIAGILMGLISSRIILFLFQWVDKRKA